MFICSPVGLSLPSRLGAGAWRHRSLPDFSVYHGIEVWKCWSIAFSWCFFPTRCFSNISARLLLYGTPASFLIPLVTILEPPRNLQLVFSVCLLKFFICVVLIFY
jgi:hypothetical protein